VGKGVLVKAVLIIHLWELEVQAVGDPLTFRVSLVETMEVLVEHRMPVGLQAVGVQVLEEVQEALEEGTTARQVERIRVLEAVVVEVMLVEQEESEAAEVWWFFGETSGQARYVLCIPLLD